MNLVEIKRLVGDKRKGSFHSIKYLRDCKTLKSAGGIVVTKETKISGVRFGVEYTKLKAVRDFKTPEELASGVVAPMPWGEWVNGCYPYIIEHKGKNYLRVTLNKACTYKTKYRVNGKITDKETALSYCLASERSNDSPKIIFSLGIENIMEIK